MIEYVYDEDRCPRYEVTASRISESSVNLAVRECVAWKAERLKPFQGIEFTPSQFEPVLTTMIKWDACSHWTYENALHLCGVDDFKRHADLHHQLLLIAFRLMGQCLPAAVDKALVSMSDAQVKEKLNEAMTAGSEGSEG